MKTVKRFVLITFFLLSLNCKHDMPREWTTISKTLSKTTKPPDSVDIKNYDSILTFIETLQIKARTDSKAMTSLCKKAFDTVSGCYFSVGKGVSNPSFPVEAQRASRKNAAKLNGEYWAALMKNWDQSDKKNINAKFEAQILYSTILYDKSIGDTLFVLMQVPLGSICFK